MVAPSRAHSRRFNLGLWLLVVAVSALDIGVTWYGLSVGFVELNPIANAAVARFGYGSLVGLKGIAVAIGLSNWWILTRYRHLVPLTFIVLWGGVGLANLDLVLAYH